MFHPFPKLPIELRLIIWEFALENETLSNTRIFLYDFHGIGPGDIFAFRRFCSPYLSTNVESRDFALKNFFTVKIPISRSDWPSITPENHGCRAGKPSPEHFPNLYCPYCTWSKTRDPLLLKEVELQERDEMVRYMLVLNQPSAKGYLYLDPKRDICYVDQYDDWENFYVGYMGDCLVASPKPIRAADSRSADDFGHVDMEPYGFLQKFKRIMFDDSLLHTIELFEIWSPSFMKKAARTQKGYKRPQFLSIQGKGPTVAHRRAAPRFYISNEHKVLGVQGPHTPSASDCFLVAEINQINQINPYYWRRTWVFDIKFPPLPLPLELPGR